MPPKRDDDDDELRALRLDIERAERRRAGAAHGPGWGVGRWGTGNYRTDAVVITDDGEEMAYREYVRRQKRGREVDR